jgi:N-acylmannosamine kinase
MIIAIDVGGTKISAALMNNGKIIEQRKVESVIHSDLINLAKHLIDLCYDWIDQAEHVAIACTGQVGGDYVNFLSAKQKLPLQSQLEAGFNIPVFIINDAAAAAWAEHCISEHTSGNGVISTTGDSDETLVYITVSTGIGGGMIQNGQLVTSTDGFCAHLGHVSVQHSAQQVIPCHCGRINCAEAIASGTAIAKQASQILNKKVSCKEVFQHYIDVPEIAQLIDQCTSAIADLIANVKAITGTQKIILGGSVGSSPLITQQVTEKLLLLPEIYQLTITPPQCGADADLIGAYYYAQQLTAQSKRS